MKLYLGGMSAVQVLRYLRSINDERLFGGAVRVRALALPVHRVSQLKKLSDESLRILSHAGEQVCALVPKRMQANAGERFKARLWSTAIPNSGFLRITEDLYVSSPAFAFLQAAQDLSVTELALLGLELCGTYSYVDESRRPPKRYYGEDFDVEFNKLPATSVRKIKALLDASSGAHGIQEAQRASRWLVDHAASPLESAVLLLLTLPKMLGGYALPKPVLNPMVRVQTALGNEVKYPDLFWQTHSIDVEYNSDYAHSGDWSRYRDSQRQVILTTNNVTVLPLTRGQVMNSDDFHVFAMGLRKKLGVRNRGYDAHWAYRNHELRGLLLKPKHQ